MDCLPDPLTEAVNDLASPCIIECNQWVNQDALFRLHRCGGADADRSSPRMANHGVRLNPQGRARSADMHCDRRDVMGGKATAFTVPRHIECSDAEATICEDRCDTPPAAGATRDAVQEHDMARRFAPAQKTHVAIIDDYLSARGRHPGVTTYHTVFLMVLRWMLMRRPVGQSRARQQSRANGRLGDRRRGWLALQTPLPVRQQDTVRLGRRGWPQRRRTRL